MNNTNVHIAIQSALKFLFLLNGNLSRANNRYLKEKVYQAKLHIRLYVKIYRLGSVHITSESSSEWSATSGVSFCIKTNSWSRSTHSANFGMPLALWHCANQGMTIFGYAIHRAAEKIGFRFHIRLCEKAFSNNKPRHMHTLYYILGGNTSYLLLKQTKCIFEVNYAIDLSSAASVWVPFMLKTCFHNHHGYGNFNQGFLHQGKDFNY